MSIVHDRPSLEQLKKQAKELLSAHQSGKPESCKVLKRLKKFSAASDKEILETKIPLHDVQYAVAMEYGFESWAKLKKFVEQRNLTFGASPDEIFEILRSVPSGENVLSVDIGSRTLKIAEFANPVNGNYTLYSFAVEEYDLSVPGESMFKTISETLRRKRNEIGFKG